MRLAIIALLLAGCQVETPPTTKTADVVQPLVESVPSPPAVNLPPDGQLLRDAQGAIPIATLRALGASGFKHLRVISKQLDEYERDECDTVVEGKIVPSGPRIKVFGRYYRSGGFWKLVEQVARGF